MPTATIETTHASGTAVETFAPPQGWQPIAPEAAVLNPARESFDGAVRRQQRPVLASRVPSIGEEPATSFLPRGTVTFLFTDIERSTARWEQDAPAMATAVERHIALLGEAIRAHGGIHYKTVGDAVQAAFATAPDAVAAALDAQRALLAEDWEVGPLRVRMALHAGEAAPDRRGDYLAAPLNRLSRLLATGHGGQILLSQAVQQLSRGALPQGVELRDLREHRLRDLLEPERIFQLVHPDLPFEFPPLKTLASRPNNLPRQPTPFLGREREVDEVIALLQRDDVHLLTLTGPGGTGKTRLALQAAADVLDAFSDGLFFVPLAPLANPTLVPSAIANALGIREEGGRPLMMRLRDFLADKDLLLVLDNFEHVAEAAPVAAELLSASSGLKILATSRAPLRLQAEREYAVLPLALPPRHLALSAEQLSRFEAVRLFIARAQAVKADFAVDTENVAAITEICRRLDGLPLAIELAAARIRLLPPRALLARLEQRLPLLTGGARDAPERQRTLRDTIAWSHELLEPEEQILFRRLAVLAGGATFEAIEAVGNHDDAIDVFAALERLIEHSLVRQESDPEGSPRFLMLETIREYGLEQLDAAGETEESRSRHAAFFVALVEEAAPALHGPTQLAWLERLEIEHDNLRSALSWTLTSDPETALRLTAALYWFWLFRGHMTEGRDWTERALAVGPSANPRVQIRALNWASAFALERADYVMASSRAEEALALARSIGDHSGEGWALINLGVVATSLGDPERGGALNAEAEERFVRVEEAWAAAAAIYNQGTWAGLVGDSDRQRMYYERALAMSQVIGNCVQTSWILSALGHRELERGGLDQARARLEEAGTIAREFRFGLIEADALAGLAEIAVEQQGDDDRVEALLGEAEAKYRELGDGLFLASGLNNLGYLTLRRGDSARAASLFEEALRLARTSGEPPTIAGFLQGLGDALRVAGDYGGAAERYQESLVLARDTRDGRVIIDGIARVAGLAADVGSNQAAARLFGVVEVLREAERNSGSRYDEERQAQDMAAVREALGPQVDAEARAAGRATHLEDAVSEALALADTFGREHRDQ